MPIYAYRCEACGHAKDVLQKISDPLLTTCPACGAEAFTKQVTAAGFQLKGSGWYVTDFRGDNKASRPAGDDAAGAASKSEAGSSGPGGSDSGKAESSKSDRAGSTGAAGTPTAPAPAPVAAPGGTTPAAGGK